MTNKFILLLPIIFIILNLDANSQNYGTVGYFDIHSSLGSSNLEYHSALNPAALMLDTSNYVGIRAKPSRFGISELNPFMINASVHLDTNFATAFNITGIGGELYSEISAELRSAYRINDIVVLGASFEFNRLTFKNYSNHSMLILNTGAVIGLSDNLNAGFTIRNLLRNHIENFDQTIAQETIAGLSFSPNNDLFIDLDAIVRINSSSALNFGIRHIFNESISGRIAVSTNPEIYEVSSRINITHDLSIMLGMNYNTVLGISPEILILYFFR